jgi:Flp pilus assembly protein TadG
MVSLRLNRWRRGRDDRGSEVLELALVLPILLLVIAGIMDFGFLFQRYEVVTNAAREGARVAILPGYGDADVSARVRSYLNASGLDGSTAAVPPAVRTIETLPSGPITIVSVTVDYPSQFLFLGPIAGLVGGSGWTSLTLRSVSVMRVEPRVGP